jgi:hypothetical protein
MVLTILILNLVLAEELEQLEELCNRAIQNLNPNGGEEQTVSMVVHSYENNSSEQTGNSVNQAQLEGQEPDLWEPVVLALQATPINFMHHEILEDAQANQDLQVSFFHLPKNLEMDPRWAAHSDADVAKSKPHLDSIRIWGRHFVPMGNMTGPQVPWSWSDFFTVALMDLVRFSWPKPSYN